MTHKTKKITTVLICLGLLLPFFSSAVYSPSVQLYVNGSSTSPITVSYNDSVNLTWSSSNTDYCQASGDWSGTKGVSGLETISNITSSKNFIITCTGTSGSATSQMAVNVTGTATSLQVAKLVQRFSETSYSDTISVNPGERVTFKIQVTAGSAGLKGIIAKDTLPANMNYLGTLKIDNVPFSGDITSGLNIGDFSGNQIKIITFEVGIADSTHFSIGTTTLINSVLVYNSSFATSDTAKVFVYKLAGAGPTNVSTGLSNNFFLDSFLLPLVMALLMIWVFKSHIISFEEWIDVRKNKYIQYKAKKLLNLKIAEIKARELNGNKKSI